MMKKTFLHQLGRGLKSGMMYVSTLLIIFNSVFSVVPVFATAETPTNDWEFIYNEESWNASYTNGILKDYYVVYDAASPYKEDLWNTVEGRAAGRQDIEKDEEGQPILYEDGYHYTNCVRNWSGAKYAPGAKYPWIAVRLPEGGFQGKIKFQYSGSEPVYFPSNKPYKVFKSRGFYIESAVTMFGNEYQINNETETTLFDPDLLQVTLVPVDVACIGDGDTNCYPSLRAAIAAASGGNTINLIADDTTSFVDDEGGYEISISKQLIINGNGHTLYGLSDYQDNYLGDDSANPPVGPDHDIYIAGSNNITIKNLTITEFGDDMPQHIRIYPIWVGQSYGGTLTLDNVTINKFNRTAVNANGGTVVISGCNFVGNDSPYNANDFFQDGIGSLNANVTVTNTNITNMRAVSDWEDSQNAACVQLNGNGTITINNEEGYTMSSCQHGIIVASEAAGTVTVNAGTMDGLLTDEADRTDRIIINGGTFSSNPASYVVSPKGATYDESNGTYTVGDCAEHTHVEAGLCVADATYTVTLPDGVTADVSTGLYGGETVTLTVTPWEHMHLVSIQANGVDCNPTANENEYTFVMGTADVTVTATFEADATYTVTLPDGVTADVSTGLYGGETVTLTVTPGEHMHLVSIQANGVDCNPTANENEYTFVMGTADVTVTAIFEADTTYTVTLPDGVTADVSTGLYGGETVTLTVTPGEHMHLVSIQANGVDCNPTANENEYTFVMGTADVTVTATFEADTTYTVTLPDGVTADVSTGLYGGETVTLTVTPGEHMHLVSIQANGVDCNPTANENEYTFVMGTADVTVTATFEADATYTVTLPDGVTADVSTGLYGGETVTLTVTPGEHMHLVSIQANGVDCNPTANENEYTFVMGTADVTVTATFEADTTYTVTLPDGVTADVSTGLYGGETVTLTVTPGEHMHLVSIQANGVDCNPTANENEYTFVMGTADVTVTATFEADTQPEDVEELMVPTSGTNASAGSITNVSLDNATATTGFEANDYSGVTTPQIVIQQKIDDAALNEVGIGESALENTLTSDFVADTGKVAEMQGILDIQLIYLDGSGNSIPLGNVNFSKPVKIIIPVTASVPSVQVRVKHQGDSSYGTTGLTLNSNATCSGGLVTSSGDAYTGGDVPVVGGKAEIYTCAASSFVAYTEEDEQTGGNNSGNGGSSGSSGGGNSGGGSVTSTTSDSTTSEESTNEEYGEVNPELQDPESQEWYDNDGDQQEVLANGFTREFNNAYQFAFKAGITTMESIQEANMTGGLTRIAMAKMLSFYAINVLGKEPDTSKTPNFGDVSDDLDKEYNNGVTLAYQLGIMGVGITDFRPYDEVPRSEFATALSRMLYGLSDGADKYYSTHIAKLYEKGVITNTDHTLKELRGYVMIMLMRSAK